MPEVQFNLFNGAQHSKLYSQYRPKYPTDLYEAIVTFHSKENERPREAKPIQTCVDIACGSGQATLHLAERYCEHVVGVDPSQAQLDNAPRADNIRYTCSSAEHTGQPAESADLITVAQALHWFDFEAFWRESDRLLVPGGTLAAWTYDLNHFEGNEAAKQVLMNLYDGVLMKGNYWKVERRKIVDGHYASIAFPWSENVQRSTHEYRVSMPIRAYIGSIMTWSGIQAYRQAHGEQQLQALMDKFKQDLMATFNATDDTQEITVVWPMYLVLTRKTRP